MPVTAEVVVDHIGELQDVDVRELNGLQVGEWTFDVFLTESGGLGFTVYEKGKSPVVDDNVYSSDICIDDQGRVAHSSFHDPSSQR